MRAENLLSAATQIENPAEHAPLNSRLYQQTARTYATNFLLPAVLCYVRSNVFLLFPNQDQPGRVNYTASATTAGCMIIGRPVLRAFM